MSARSLILLIVLFASVVGVGVERSVSSRDSREADVAAVRVTNAAVFVKIKSPATSVAAGPAAVAAPTSQHATRTPLETLVIARAEDMLLPSEHASEDDRWLSDKAAALSPQEGASLARLAAISTTPYPARFTSVMLIAASTLPERRDLLASIAAAPVPALGAQDSHLSVKRAHEHIVRKLAIDSLALAGATAQELGDVARRQADPRLNQYALKVSRLVGSGRFMEARQQEDDALARIASGGIQ